MSANNKVYLDNAATSPLDERVIDAMYDVMKTTYGNPSASHSIGRSARAVVETARKQIAKSIGASANEIIFTSGGTEADNMALRCAIHDLGVSDIITSPIEHKAVLDTALQLEADGLATVHLVNVNDKGDMDLQHLSELASKHKGALISLMHANNEIGTLLPYQKVAEIAKENNCLFHSDTVQTMGHYHLNVEDFGADFLTCSAHKLNGPKGIGFLYVRNTAPIKTMITGGGQERSHRAGTENVIGIVGLAKALEIAFEHVVEEEQQIQNIKSYMREQLLEHVEGISFNGREEADKSLYTVLSCSVPPTNNNDLLLFQLDIEGICCSGGSACNSGAAKGSHVLEAIGHPTDRKALRFSFGRFTTKEDVDQAVSVLAKLVDKTVATV